MHGHVLPKNSKLRRKVTLTEFDVSKVDQERSYECEINNIVERHIKTRQPLPTGQNEYVDATTIPNDMQTRLNAVHQGKMAWDSLPKAVKRQYKTPNEFLTALQSPEHEEALTALGFKKLNKTTETSVSESKGEPAKPGGA